MSIRKGDKAEGFELPRKPGEMVNVGQHIGREPVVLLFFPLSFSPVCTDEMCTMRDDWASWEKLNAKIFGLSVDSPFVTDRFQDDERIPFPLLSDFNKEVATRYGVLHDDLKGMKGVAKRAVFVIGADGTVVYDWVTEDPRTQIPFDEVRAALEGVCAGTT